MHVGFVLNTSPPNSGICSPLLDVGSQIWGGFWLDRLLSDITLACPSLIPILEMSLLGLHLCGFGLSHFPSVFLGPRVKLLGHFSSTATPRSAGQHSSNCGFSAGLLALLWLCFWSTLSFWA